MSGLRVAVVGAGAGIFSAHRAGLEAIGAQVVAVHDVDGSAAARVAAELGCPAAATLDDLLAVPSDLAVVVTPHAHHPTIAIACLRAGRDVLVEKPMALTAAEAGRMCAAAELAGRRLVVCFQRRTAVEVREARRLVRAGALGELRRVDVVAQWPRRSSYYALAPWRGTWRGEAGGVLMNQAQHDLDLLCHLAGLPDLAVAWCTTAVHPIETEDTVVALLGWPNGATGTLRASTAQLGEPLAVELAGTRGRLSLREGRLTWWAAEEDFSVYAAAAGDPFAAPPLDEPVSVKGPPVTHVDLYRALVGGDPELAEGREGAAPVELANALVLSGQTGTELTVPVDPARFEEFLRSR